MTCAAVSWTVFTCVFADDLRSFCWLFDPSPEDLCTRPALVTGCVLDWTPPTGDGNGARGWLTPEAEDTGCDGRKKPAAVVTGCGRWALVLLTGGEGRCRCWVMPATGWKGLWADAGGEERWWGAFTEACWLDDAWDVDSYQSNPSSSFTTIKFTYEMIKHQSSKINNM